MNEVERYGQQPFDGPIYREGPAPKLISRRLYNVLLTGFVLLSFVIMAACSYITGTYEFMLFMLRNPFALTIGMLVGSIAGCIVMSIGRSKESLPMGLIGYALFTLTFGFSTSLILGMYDMQTISLAFSATAGIMIVFGAAGIMFPQFFQRIQGVLITALIALFVVQLIDVPGRGPDVHRPCCHRDILRVHRLRRVPRIDGGPHGFECSVVRHRPLPGHS